MTDEQHRVEFRFTEDYVTYYSEAQLAEPGSALRARFASAQDPEGAIDIWADEEVIRIADVLAPWVQNLCYGAIAELTNGHQAEVIYAARPGRLTLTPAEDRINISGDFTPAVSMELTPFLAALLDCGDRFSAFAQEVKRGDPEFLAQMSDWPKLRKAAQAAIAAREHRQRTS